MLKVGWRNLIKSAVSFSSNWSGVRSDSLLIVGKSKIWASSLTSSSSSSSSTTESSSWMMLQKKEKKKKSINSFSIHIFPDILKSTVRTLISRWHIWVHSPILIPPFINLRIIELIIPRSEIKEASGTEKKRKCRLDLHVEHKTHLYGRRKRFDSIHSILFIWIVYSSGVCFNFTTKVRGKRS